MRYFLLSIGFACLYAVIHDMITARICLEYFTEWHPFLVDSRDPSVVAVAWGIAATWWVPAILGVLLAWVAARGSRPKFPVTRLIHLFGWLGLAMALGAILAGVVGYLYVPADLAERVGYHGNRPERFLADLFAHNASYILGFVGGVFLIFRVASERRCLD